MLRAILLAFHCQIIDFGSTNPNWPFFSRIHLYTFIFSSPGFVPISRQSRRVFVCAISTLLFRSVAQLILPRRRWSCVYLTLKAKIQHSNGLIGLSWQFFTSREHSQPRVWSRHLIRKLNCVVYKQVPTSLLLLLLLKTTPKLALLFELFMLTW